jgi:FkbM family methyltransferase
MQETFVKRLLRRIYFPEGAVRRIRLGPLAGYVFQVGEITGLSPWYSGPERAHQRMFRALLTPGAIALDVGANWGSHSLYFSRLVGAMGRVVALEPFPAAFAALTWHLSANRCRNVTPLPVAASNTSGEAFFQAGESASTGQLSASEATASSGSRTIVVKTRTIDQVCGLLELPRLDLIKIDVEGAEGRALSGADTTIARFRPYLVIDLHTPEQDLQVAHWLTSRNYRLERIVGPPIRNLEHSWPDPQGVWGSILARPAERLVDLQK